MWAWVGSVALAVEPVVHEGGAEAAVARVAQLARVDAADLEPVAVEVLRSRAPALVGSGSVLPCTRQPVTREQVVLALDGAEAALNFDDTARAAHELERITDARTCPPPFDRELLTRMWVDRALAGVEAETALAWARSLSPDLAWTDDWPADLRSTFDGAAPLAPVSVRVVQDGVAIDGAPVRDAVSLTPGWHAVTLAGFAGALVVDADATFVVPSQTPPDLFAGVADEAGRGAPTALMADAFGPGHRVYVATGDGVWAATAGRTDWLPLQRLETHPLVPIGAATGAVGLLGTAGAGVLVALSASQARTAAADALTTDPAAYADASSRYDGAAATHGVATVALIPAGVLLVGGASMLGIGVAHGPVTVGGGR